MLTDSATLAMPPTATWFGGRNAVAAGLRAWPLAGDRQWQLTPTRANGQLAAIAYLRDSADGNFMPQHIAVLTLRGALIEQINAFHDLSTPTLDPIGPPSRD